MQRREHRHNEFKGRRIPPAPRRIQFQQLLFQGALLVGGQVINNGPGHGGGFTVDGGQAVLVDGGSGAADDARSTMRSTVAAIAGSSSCRSGKRFMAVKRNRVRVSSVGSRTHPSELVGVGDLIKAGVDHGVGGKCWHVTRYPQAQPMGLGGQSLRPFGALSCTA